MSTTPIQAAKTVNCKSIRRIGNRIGEQRLARAASDSLCPRQRASETLCEMQTVTITSFSSPSEDGGHAKTCPASMARVRKLPGRLRRQSATDNSTGRVAASRAQPLREQGRTGRTFARTFEDGGSAKRCNCEVPRRNLQFQPAPSRHMLASRRRRELVGLGHESTNSFRAALPVASARTYNASSSCEVLCRR